MIYSKARERPFSAGLPAGATGWRLFLSVSVWDLMTLKTLAFAPSLVSRSRAGNEERGRRARSLPKCCLTMAAGSLAANATVWLEPQEPASTGSLLVANPGATLLQLTRSLHAHSFSNSSSLTSRDGHSSAPALYKRLPRLSLTAR